MAAPSRVVAAARSTETVPAWVWPLAALFIIASLDRPPEMRLVVRGVPVEIGLALLWLLASWVVLAPGRRARVAGGWRVLVAGLPWLLVMLVSSGASLAAVRVVPYALRAWTLCVALFLGWIAFGRSERRQALEIAVMVGIVLQAGIALGQLLLGAERGTGSFFIATTLGGYMALVLPLAVVRATRPGHWRNRWRVLATVAAGILVLSLSRAPLFAAVAGCVVALVGSWSAPPRRRRRILATGLGAALLLVSLLVLGALAPKEEGLEEASSDWHRLDPRVAGAHLLDLRLPIYRLGWEIWRDRPWLGIGGGSPYASVAAEYTSDADGPYAAAVEKYPGEAARRTYLRHTHQQYLQVAVEYGLLGLLTWLFLILWLVVRLSSLLRREHGADAAIGAGMLVAFLLHGMLDLLMPVLGIELGLLVGAFLGDPRGAASAGQPGDRTGRIGEPKGSLASDAD